MVSIKVYDYVHGKSAISYDDGYRCLQDILTYVDKEDVSLDFSGVDFVITAFLNPVIGDLILKKGAGIMGKIRIINANENDVTDIMDHIHLVDINDFLYYQYCVTKKINFYSFDADFNGLNASEYIHIV